MSFRIEKNKTLLCFVTFINGTNLICVNSTPMCTTYKLGASNDQLFSPNIFRKHGSYWYRHRQLIDVYNNEGGLHQLRVAWD